MTDVVSCFVLLVSVTTTAAVLGIDDVVGNDVTPPTKLTDDARDVWSAAWNKRLRRAVRKAGSLGGSRMMECQIGYPGGRFVEHIITWRKQGNEVPVFVQFNGYPPHVDAEYQGRIRLVEQASIEISDLRTADEGWYECSVVFLNDAATDDVDDGTNNGTWIHLSVYCELLSVVFNNL